MEKFDFNFNDFTNTEEVVLVAGEYPATYVGCELVAINGVQSVRFNFKLDNGETKYYLRAVQPKRIYVKGTNIVKVDENGEPIMINEANSFKTRLLACTLHKDEKGSLKTILNRKLLVVINENGFINGVKTLTQQQTEDEDIPE